MSGTSLETIAVTAGRGERRPDEPLNPPVVFAGPLHAGGPVAYGRYGNPTWSAFEEALGALDGGTAVVYSSGMAAVSTVFEMLPVGATIVAPRDCYLGARAILTEGTAAGRFSVRLVDVCDTAATLAACEGAALLWIESPTNPLLGIADIAALSAGARARGARTSVDSTFAPPLVQRPLDLGADVVMHSVTKYLAGHSDLQMGALVTRDPAILESLRRRRKLHGAVPGPLEAWLALRGLRTLGVRLERAQRSAAEIARRLSRHPAVERVHFPGLPDDPGHALASRQMRGFGAMLSFVLRGTADQAETACGAVRVAVHSTSLGGVETLIERRAKWAGEENVSPSLLRLSVGIEDLEDLWSDLIQAFSAAGLSGPAGA